MSIDFKELRELLTSIAQTDISELTLKSDEFELTVRKGSTVVQAQPVLSSPLTPITPAVVPPPPKTVVLPTPSESPAPPPVEKKGVEITSPMVGTFYRASAPDEAPFVEVGDRIGKGQIVCIIEAMKLMNEIEAEISGTVVEVLVENGQAVEYGQTLMYVKID